MCQTRQKSVTNSPNLHNDPVARPGSYGASRPDNALTCLPWAVVSAAQRLDSRRPCGSAVPGGLQQQKSTFQVCADNRHQTTDMTCGCRRAVAHIARCMTANGRSLDGVPSSPIRGASIKPLGCPGDSLASFRHRGRWGSGDGFPTTSRTAASTSRAGGYPCSGQEAGRDGAKRRWQRWRRLAASPKGLVQGLVQGRRKGSDARMTGVVRRCGPCQ